MKTEQLGHSPNNEGNVIWINNVELASQEEVLPIIGSNQLPSIFTHLEDLNSTKVIPIQQSNENLDLNLGNTFIKQQPVTLELENNFIILKDNDEKPFKSEIKKNVKLKTNKNDFSDMLYFVCNLCPFLCTKDTKITEHLAAAHKNKTARKLPQLKCPACKNVFYHKVSLRSHLIHDHGVGNSDLNRIIQAISYYSKEGNKREAEKTNKPVHNGEILIKNQIDELEVSNGCEDVNDNHSDDDDIDVKKSKIELKSDIVTLPQVDISKINAKEIYRTIIKQNGTKNHQKNSFKCNIPDCKVQLQDPNKMSYHTKCHVDSTFKCLECGEGFLSWKPLSGHLWRVHKIDMELFSCDKCEYKTYSLGKLNSIHKLIHGDVKAFSCKECDKAFKNTKQLRNHMASHKKKDEAGQVWICELCCKQFTAKRYLTIHMDVVHKKIRPYLCSYCGYKGSSKSSLKMHIRQHTGEKPFTCDTCSYSTSDHNSLRRHKRRHTGQKPYKCVYCSYACIQSSTYKVHLKTKHPGLEKDLMFSCEECQFRSVNKEIYMSHVLTTHKNSVTNDNVKDR